MMYRQNKRNKRARIARILMDEIECDIKRKKER